MNSIKRIVRSFREKGGPALMAFALLITPSAHAALTMTLSGTPGASLVQVSFSGSSVATGTGGGIINFGWDFLPATYDPFPAAITGFTSYGMFLFQSGNATYRNVTRDLSTTITGVWLQDSSNSAGAAMGIYERFGILAEFNGPGQNNYIVGDVYEWAGSASIDLSARGLTFDDLRPGTTGVVSGSLNILQGQLVIVPEPTSATLLISGLLLLLAKTAGRAKRIEI